MKLRHLSMKLTAAAITAVLACQNPIQAFAAAKPVYISDLLISYAKSDSEEDIAAAKKWLTDQGYTVLDQDLNEEADNLVTAKRPVFLGYKKTNSAEEAITDIRLMNMEGDYSYDDYADLVKSQKQAVGEFLTSVKSALASYRENFSYVQDILKDYGKTYDEIGTVLAEHPDDFDGSCYRAMIAYENLNQFIDDDTGYPLGELLLEPIREEISDWTQQEDGAWTAPPDGEAHADMTTILMQGNSGAVRAIMSTLAYVADTDYETSWVTRAETSEGMTPITNRYTEEFPALPESKIQRMIAADYDAHAGELSENIAALRSYVKAYTESGITLKTDQDQIDAYFKMKEHENESMIIWTNAGLITEQLKYRPAYGGQTLYDILLANEYDFTQISDRMELYPLLDTMTEAQRSLLPYVSLDKMLTIGMTETDEQWEAAYAKNREMFGGIKQKSVYEGVNRAMFDTNGGTALTRTAVNHQTTTKESYTDIYDANANFLVSEILAGVALASFATGVTMAIIGAKRVPPTEAQLWKNLDAAAKTAGTTNKALQEASDIVRRQTVGEILNENGEVVEIAALADDVDEAIGMSEAEAAFTTTKQGASTATTALRFIGWGICLAAILMSILAGVSALIEMSKVRNVDYKRIPKYIVHGVQQEKKAWEEEGSWKYTYYTSVKCNRGDGFNQRDNVKEMSDCGDLNGDVGRQWVAVYTTKDLAAGNPITADSLAVGTSSKPPIGKQALTYFGENYAANLNNPNYVFNNSAPARYIYFSHSTTTFAGSVHNGGMVAAVTGLAALAGGLVCFFAVSRDGRKRREEEAA